MSTEKGVAFSAELPPETQVALSPLFIPVMPSRWPDRLLCGTSFLVFTALYFARLSLTLSLLLGTLWCLCVVLQRKNLKRYAVASVSISGGEWRLASVSNRWSEEDSWLFEGDYSWHPWLLSVRLRRRHTGRCMQVLLYPDSASRNDLRRMRVLLPTLKV